MLAVAEIQELIRERSPLPPAQTEEVIRKRFASVPGRLRFALERWPLASSAVLDVGCSYGHCLVRFGPGSTGVDNVSEHVEFCRALGLDAVQADVDSGLEPVPDGAFDFVWLSDIVEHLDAPRLVLRRLRPKLTPSGTLLLTISPLPRNRLAARILSRRGVRPFEANAHHYQFTIDTARYLVERTGYRVVSVEVPFLPDRARRLTPGLVPISPRVLIAARPDEDAERLAQEAERKNKPAPPE
jgi:SAM-dependent methyltransferase